MDSSAYDNSSNLKKVIINQIIDRINNMRNHSHIFPLEQDKYGNQRLNDALYKNSVNTLNDQISQDKYVTYKTFNILQECNNLNADISRCNQDEYVNIIINRINDIIMKYSNDLLSTNINSFSLGYLIMGNNINIIFML